MASLFPILAVLCLAIYVSTPMTAEIIAAASTQMSYQKRHYQYG